MWPKLSNIEDSIYINLTSAVSSSKVGFNASQRVAWVRIFSGAQTTVYSGEEKVVKDKEGKDVKVKGTKNRNGLILSSVNSSDVFKAAGELKQTTYGNSISSGDMGVSWDNELITSGMGGGLKPSPIVTALELKEGKDQISRECTLTLKAFTLEQMESIQTYFLEPGYSLCIEYGWNSINGAKSLIKTNSQKNRTASI